MYFLHPFPPHNHIQLQPTISFLTGSKRPPPFKQYFLYSFFQGPWFLIPLWCPNFFSEWAWFLQKLAAASKFDKNEIKTAGVPQMSE